MASIINIKLSKTKTRLKPYLDLRFSQKLNGKTIIIPVIAVNPIWCTIAFNKLIEKILSSTPL
jgi:hypothetical protein